jgi:hypothetical protein
MSSAPNHHLYDDLADWWPVLSPPETYDEECEVYLDLLDRPASLLELGSGGGHLASHIGGEVEVVLMDRSQPMLSASERLNPHREHVCGDMRTLRLGRSFQAVLLHDAVMYLTSREALFAAFATAAAHLEPGGLFLVLPDDVAETFEEATITGGGDDGERSARMMEWQWDPDPSDDTIQVEFSFLLRQGGQVRAVHESHTFGLFDRATFWQGLREAGFEPAEPDPLLAAQSLPEVFLARKR